MLWIQGLYSSAYPSNTTIISAGIISAAQNSSTLIPIISYFCPDPNNYEYFEAEEDDEDEDQGDKKETTPDDRAEALLVDFAYSMIWHLLHLLPPTLKTKIDLSPPRFSAVDGTSKTWIQALTLLTSLQILSPPLLLIVIDGIERLDNTSAESELRELLEKLQNVYLDILEVQVASSDFGDGIDRGRRDGDEEGNKVIKILFTTAGSSEALNELDLDVLETVRFRDSRSRHERLGIKAGRGGWVFLVAMIMMMVMRYKEVAKAL